MGVTSEEISPIVERSKRGAIALVACVTLCAGILSAQQHLDTRLDHFGLGAQRLRALCAPSHPGNEASLFQESKRLQLAVKQPDANRDTWRAYACVSALLYADASREKRGADSTLSHNAWSAIDGFLNVLGARANDSIAVSGLATLALDVSGGPDVSAILGYIPIFAEAGYQAVRAGVRIPTVLRMCTDFALANADMATARLCIDRALALGIDSTWNLLRVSRMAFMGDDINEGNRLFRRAMESAHDSGSLGEARWNADESSEFPEPIFLVCPLSVTLNGTRIPADRSGCYGPTPQPVKPIDITFTVLQFWDPVSQAPISLLMYLMQQNTLQVTFSATSRSVNADFNLRRLEWDTGQWTDSTWAMHIPLSNDLISPLDLPGYTLLPPPHGTSTWALSVLQPGRHGAESIDHVEPLGAGPYALSDLVIGSTAQHTVFKLADDTIVLAPLGTVKRSKPFELYYQLRSDSADAGFTTKILLRRIDGGHIVSEPELTFRFVTPVVRGINPIHKEIDLSRLGKGDHQLEVMVLDASGRVVARRATYVIPR